MVDKITRKWDALPLTLKGGFVIALPVFAILFIAAVGVLDIAGSMRARRSLERTSEGRRRLGVAAYEMASAWGEYTGANYGGRTPDFARIETRLATAEAQLAAVATLLPEDSPNALRLSALHTPLSAFREGLLSQTFAHSPVELEGEAAAIIGTIETIFAEEQARLTAEAVDFSRARVKSFYLFMASILAGLLTGLIAALAYLKGIVRRIGALGAYAESGTGEKPKDRRLTAPDEIGKLAERIRAGAEAVRQRESEAVAARARLEAVMQNLTSPLFIKDRAGHYVYVNDAYTRLHGIDRENLIGRTRFELGDPESAERMRESDLRVIDSGQPTVQKDVSNLGGVRRTFLVVRFCIPSETGEDAPLLCCIATEITEHERALEELKESRAELEDRVQERTTELRQQLARAALINQIVRATAGRHDLASMLQAVLGHLRESMQIDFGTVLYCSLQSRLLIVGARVESTAQDGPTKLQPGEIVTLEAGPLAESLTGRGSIISAEHGEDAVIAWLRSQGLASLMIAPLRVSEEPYGVLLVGKRTTDSFTANDLEFLRDLGQHVSLALAQLRLINELKRACDDLRQTQQHMATQERLRAMGQMASGIAHDINNALGPVIVYSELLLELPELHTEVRASVQPILDAGNRIAKTVASLRQFYLPEGETPQFAPVELNTLVNQVVAATKPRWHDLPLKSGAHVRLVTDLDPQSPVLHGKDDELRNALTNLIFNAVDAMPTGGTITISTHRKEEHAMLSVRDTGIGMDGPTKQRCFEPFFTTKGESGTGLGLAMVFGIVERHSGSIKIESQPGEGTEFRITLPLSQDAGVVEVIGEVRPSRFLKVLCVDDERTIQAAVATALRSDGHDVTLAENGAGAIELCHRYGGEKPFDVVLTDLGMPGMDGRELAARLKERWSQLPVILLTGWGDQLLDQSVAMPEFVAILAKPPRIRELREALVRACSGN